MPFPQLVLSAGAGGIAEYDTWADLPSGPADGAQALVLDAQIGAVAQDGVWLPAPLVGGRTLTRDATLSFGLAEDTADLAAAGWTLISVTKAAGDPLQISGTYTGSRIWTFLPSGRTMARIEYAVTSGKGWLFTANDGPTRRADFFLGDDSVERVNSGSAIQDGPRDAVGEVFLLLDWTGATPAVAWWGPGAQTQGFADFGAVAPSALEGYSSALFARSLFISGAYSGTATYTISRLDLWEVT